MFSKLKRFIPSQENAGAQHAMSKLIVRHGYAIGRADMDGEIQELLDRREVLREGQMKAARKALEEFDIGASGQRIRAFFDGGEHSLKP